MKLMKSFLVIGIVFSMILNSCSIEKRVHRSGYHIEWHHSKQDKNNQDISDVKETEPAVENVNLSKVKEENEINGSENSATTLLDTGIGSENRKMEISTSKPDLLKNNEAVSEAESKSASEVVSKSKSKSKNHSIQSEYNNMQGFGEGKSGIFLLIVGLIMLGLAWVFYAYLGIIGLIFAIIFSIAGAIYLIVGIISLIVNA